MDEVSTRELTDDQYVEWLGKTGGYVFVIPTPDGRWCGVLRLMFHWTIHVGLVSDRSGCHEERYCFQTFELAADALTDWMVRDFKGEPINWHYHPSTGRRRKDANPATEYVAY